MRSIRFLRFEPPIPAEITDMQREPEFFDVDELELVFMARTLREALRLEKILTDEKVEYLVETGIYTAGLFIKRDLTGAFFYVAPASVEQTKVILIKNKFQPYTGS